MLLLTIGKHHFAQFHDRLDPCGFCNVGVACKILDSDNRGSDNWGCTVLAYKATLMPNVLWVNFQIISVNLIMKSLYGFMVREVLYGGYAQRTGITYHTWKCQTRNFWCHLLYWLTTRCIQSYYASIHVWTINEPHLPYKTGLDCYAKYDKHHT